MSQQLALRESQELLFFAYRAFTSAPDAMLNKRGWTRVHHRIMHFIAREPGITVSGLLEKLQVSKQALHGPLKVLIGEGVVLTEASQSDRRVKQLYLSPSGAQLEQTLSAPQIDLLKRAFAECSEQTLIEWRAVMNAIIEEEQRSR
jgi:DNA-binding MarR family transcriptional regulator